MSVRVEALVCGVFRVSGVCFLVTRAPYSSPECVCIWGVSCVSVMKTSFRDNELMQAHSEQRRNAETCSQARAALIDER